MKAELNETSPMSANIDEAGAHYCLETDQNRFTKQDAYAVWVLLTDLASQLYGNQGMAMGFSEDERLNCLRGCALVKRSLHKIISYEGVNHA